MNTNQNSFFILIPLFFICLPLFSDVTAEQEEMLKQLPPDQRTAIMGKMTKSNDLKEELEETFSKKGFLVERPDENDEEYEKCKECIYGYDLFRFSPSTFAPANIVPVSSSYTLGPGDELTVNFYGSNKATKTAFISRDGTLNLPIIGSINLTGLTFSAAQDNLNKKIKEELAGTEASLSLNRLRSIMVYVLGEAYKPGAYTLSALSTVTNTLFLSGGVNKQGSLRNIEIKRGGKLLKKYDLYDLLIKGDTTTDIRLEDGDTIFIPFIENRVTLGGSFKRPYIYELLNGETLEEAISFAGGFKPEVGFNPIIELNTINRNSNKRDITRIIYNKNLNIEILDGDTLNVAQISGLKPLSVELTGEFNNPGVYSIRKGDTVLDIILKAGGYTESAFTEGAIYLREEVAKIEKEGFERSADQLEQVLFEIVQDSDTEITEFSLVPISRIIEKLRTIEPVGRVVTSLDILELKTDPYANFELRHGDKIHIPERPSSVSVVGEVLKATSMQFLPEYKLNDYLNFAGGLNSQADREGIYVIEPNGEAKLYKRQYLRSPNIQIIPGSTIVVVRDPRPWDAVKVTQIISPILADLATSAAALAVLNTSARL